MATRPLRFRMSGTDRAKPDRPDPSTQETRVGGRVSCEPRKPLGLGQFQIYTFLSLCRRSSYTRFAVPLRYNPRKPRAFAVIRSGNELALKGRQKHSPCVNLSGGSPHTKQRTHGHSSHHRGARRPTGQPQPGNCRPAGQQERKRRNTFLSRFVNEKLGRLPETLADPLALY